MNIICSFNVRVKEKKHKKKIEQNDLRYESGLLWKFKGVKAVTSTLGTISKNFEKLEEHFG